MTEPTESDKRMSSAKLFDAIGELALAIAPHNMDREQRARIAAAMGVLIEHVLAEAARRGQP